MGMTTSNALVKGYTAGGTIAARTLVKFGASDGTVVAASAVADFIIGVTGEIDVSSGERVDVFLSGIAQVKTAGVINRGDFVTTDASGLGVAAAPAAGTNNRVLGIAEQTSASGDIITVIVSPQRIQG